MTTPIFCYVCGTWWDENELDTAVYDGVQEFYCPQCGDMLYDKKR